ncbi:hypothetical protein [Bulleidia sp. zg-1006]|uniref:hypothetical protein n=1 Tax=Bulleidia sp. zg-1006 TaxID=2806552 RepID=UPI001939481D|nr:hypothetical protein [Bulleidia sp. zg-1006]QRG86375.1 hypothetical protein JOS54_05845 [Bulleidia sp. zg-1006]
MASIKGITVKILPKVQIGLDEFNAPIYEDGKAIEVENVLVAPVGSQENLDVTNLYGKKAQYQIAIPKGDEHTWTDAIVEFFGYRWHVFSLSQKGIEKMIPLEWNDKYYVERYE